MRNHGFGRRDVTLFRSATAALLAGTIVGVSFFTAPVNAQGNSTGCTQEAVGGNTNPGRSVVGQGQAANSQQTLVGVISAAVSNVSVLGNTNVDALNQALSNITAPIQVVCLNDALNQNDVRLLQNILNESPILSDNLNNSLNNNEVIKNSLNNLLQNSDIAIANGVQVVSVDVASGELFLLRQ